MKFIRIWLMATLTVLVAACGGGGGSSSGSGSGSTPVAVGIVEVVSSSNTLESAGGSVAITAFVKTTGNVGLSARTVTFAATSGQLQNIVATTDSNGVATASLIAGGNKANRSIRVTVTSGSVSGFVDVIVTGSRITISGAGSLQAFGAATQYRLKALDSAGNGIAGTQLTIASALSNPLNTTTVTTDGLGEALVTLSPNVAGTETLTVGGVGTSASQQIFISSENFSILSPGAGTEIFIGAGQTVTAQYIGAVQAGRTVTFSTTRGTVSPAVVLTNASGIATTTVSSFTAGPSNVSASLEGIAQSLLAVEFVATTPASLVLQANPSAVKPNASGSTANKATLVALVRDASGNPVKNRTVNFSALDPSGGSLSPASAVTDSNGLAQTSFIPGAVSTAANGVVVTATVAATAVQGTTALTVSGSALFITIGNGNTIENYNDETYKRNFTLYVTDANGAPVGSKAITLSVFPLEYRKGYLAWDDSAKAWVYAGGSPQICANEDANANGVLDAGEDINGNGRLEPGMPALITPASVTTDANGFATFSLLYGENYAMWGRVRIRATATVAGTESSANVSYFLQAMASDLTTEGTAPAGVNSPFGTDLDCTIPPPAP